MHGLVFVTWEKYLLERFGSTILSSYRNAIGETPINAPLASKIYDDEMLLAGVGTACRITGLPAHTILREYGRYFMLNGLTNHLCAYLLTRVHSGRELLLVMRDAHNQMHYSSESITPPLFSYEPLTGLPNGIVLIYDSPRQLCPVLYGAVEGAAERYGEKVTIIEQSCMKKGADVCRLELHFTPGTRAIQEPPEQLLQQLMQQQLADLVLTLLPHKDGVTFLELHQLLQNYRAPSEPVRPSALLKALRHLQYAGLVASTANQPGDNLTQRRYWRAPLAKM
jgi:hypothetical protein